MTLNVERIRLETTEQWQDWIAKIPDIQFPPSWRIRIIPPFAGALVRFQVRLGDKAASVYLDVDNSLGYCSGPYWEVYPVNDNNERVYMADVAGLLALIERALLPDLIGELGGGQHGLPRPE